MTAVALSEAPAPAPATGAADVAVTLIIPAHNEQMRIVPTLDRYHAALAGHFDAFEIIVVANGCHDETVARARAAGARLGRTSVVAVEERIGKGGAILVGFRFARGSRIVFADADGATADDSLVTLLHALDDADVAVGSRRIQGSLITRRQPLNRRVLGACFATVVHTMFDVGVRDTQCGAKALRATTARAIAASVKEEGWAFDLDLLLAARRAGARVVECPVAWADQPGSRLQIAPAARDVSRSLWRIHRAAAAAACTDTERAAAPRVAT